MSLTSCPPHSTRARASPSRLIDACSKGLGLVATAVALHVNTMKTRSAEAAMKQNQLKGRSAERRQTRSRLHIEVDHVAVLLAAKPAVKGQRVIHSAVVNLMRA